MKTYFQFLMEVLSGINITDPQVQQRMKDLLNAGKPKEFLELYKQHAGHAKPAHWKDGDKYFDEFGHAKKSKHLGPASLDKKPKKLKTEDIEESEEILTEASYAGNMGGMEMFQFHADPSIPKREKERHLTLMKSGFHQRAIKMVEQYIAKKIDRPDFKFHPSVYPKPK